MNQWGLGADGEAKNLPTIRSRLILLVLACLLPASFMAAGLIAYSNKNERAALVQASMNTARAIMSAVDRDLDSVEAGLLALATSPYLTAEDFVAFDAQAREVLKTQRANNLFLIDVNFDQRINTLLPLGSEAPRIVNPQLREVFKTGMPVTTDLYYGRVSRTAIIAIAVPVIRNGNVDFVLGAGILPGRLSRLLANQHVSGDWIASILDSTGTIVARTHQMERFVGTKGVASVIARIGQVPEDSMEVDSVEGIRILSVFSRSAVSNWTVAIGIPASLVNKGLWETLTWLIVGLMILLASSLTLAWMIGRRIAASIRQLAAPALALGSGAEVRVPPLHLREADEVGQALRRASAMLKSAQHRASHDTLTGLANRALFDEILTHQLAICSRDKTSLSVACIDLDGFKPVNDRHGHAAGDRVLRAVADRLTLAVRESDLAARIGGDEFALILVRAELAAARSVAAKLIESLSAPYVIGELTLHLSASIGIASYPESGTRSDDLSRRADEAMYRAKAMGKGRYSAARPISAGNGSVALEH